MGLISPKVVVEWHPLAQVSPASVTFTNFGRSSHEVWAVCCQNTLRHRVATAVLKLHSCSGVTGAKKKETNRFPDLTTAHPSLPSR